MSHPRQVLRSSIFPSPAIFLRDSGLSRFSGSDNCSGQNSVWMTSKKSLFVNYIQYLLSTVMEIMSLMNTSIDDYLDSMFTSRASDFARWLSDWSLSSSRSRFLFGELRYILSHESSLSVFFLRSIYASLIVLYSYGAGVVPKGSSRQIKASFSTIVMQVDTVLAFAWIWR